MALALLSMTMFVVLTTASMRALRAEASKTLAAGEACTQTTRSAAP